MPHAKWRRGQGQKGQQERGWFGNKVCFRNTGCGFAKEYLLEAEVGFPEIVVGLDYCGCPRSIAVQYRRIPTQVVLPKGVVGCIYGAVSVVVSRDDQARQQSNLD